VIVAGKVGPCGELNKLDLRLAHPLLCCPYRAR